MRKSNVMWLLLAGFCSAALYHTSQRVHDGREMLDALNGETAQEEESIRVLQAEWSYLNQPQRLEQLAHEHLNLVPMKGDRFAAIDDIAMRAAPVATPKPDVAEKPAAIQKPEPTKLAAPKTVAPKPAPAKPAAEKPAAAEIKAAARQTAAVLDTPPHAPAAQKVVRKQEPPARRMSDVIKSLGVD